MPNKKDEASQTRADEVIDNANRDYRTKTPNLDKPEANLSDREQAAADARSKQTVFDRATGIMGPHDFDGTKPEDIMKMAHVKHVGNLPLGPGQVTGGASIQGGKANEALPQPSGGDRTPGQSGNPPADKQDEAARSRVVV